MPYEILPAATQLTYVSSTLTEKLPSLVFPNYMSFYGATEYAPYCISQYWALASEVLGRAFRILPYTMSEKSEPNQLNVNVV